MNIGGLRNERGGRRSRRLLVWIAACLALGPMLLLVAAPVDAGGSWSAATNIDGTTYINGVSCVSSSFCVTVDNAGNALYYNGTTWTGPTAISGAAATIYQVSCVSTTFCMAVDSSGDALQYSGGTTWTKSTPDTAALKAVSCFSTTFCMAVDASGNALIYNGTWGAVTNVDGTNAFYAVSCPSATFCEAVDGVGNAVKYSSGTYSVSLIDGSGGGFNSVSCLSAASCIAGDGSGNVLSWNGTAWSAPKNIDPSQIEWAVCLSTSSCMAVDGAGGVVNDNGGTWSAPVTIDGTNSFSSMSCPTASFCVAVDSVGNALTYTGSGVSVAASLGITAGTLAFVSTPASFAFTSVTLNGSNQTTTASVPLDIGDATGSGNGWNVTLSATTFTNAASETLADGDFQVLGGSPPTVACDASSTCNLSTLGSLYPYTLNGTGTKLLSSAANTGMGDQTVTIPWSASIPANAYAGTYTSTWTFTLVSGP